MSSTIKYKIKPFFQGDEWDLLIPFTLRTSAGVVAPVGYSVTSKLFDSRDNAVFTFTTTIIEANGVYTIKHSAAKSETLKWPIGVLKFNLLFTDPAGKTKSTSAIEVEILKKLS